jgi:hypothetical protein
MDRGNKFALSECAFNAKYILPPFIWLSVTTISKDGSSHVTQYAADVENDVILKLQ